MEKHTINKIIKDALLTILEENNINDIDISDKTEIFGTTSIIDSLQLINLVVKIEDQVYETFNNEIVIVDDSAIISGNSPFHTISSFTDYVYDKIQNNY